MLQLIGVLSQIMAAKLQSKTVTPTAAGLTVLPDDGFDGLSEVVINGDSDLVAANIKSGVNIFGVAGSAKTAETLRSKAITLTMPYGESYTIANIGFKPFFVVASSDKGYGLQYFLHAIRGVDPFYLYSNGQSVGKVALSATFSDNSVTITNNNMHVLSSLSGYVYGF